MITNFLNIDDIDSIKFNEIELKSRRMKDDTIYYYNIPCSYDIETSSFKDEYGNPVAIVYTHCIDINGKVFLFRTWEETLEFYNRLVERAGLNIYNRIIIYVHNLSYEFQFMKHHFNFIEVFSNGGPRKIMKAITNNGLEFRCSYMLSGSSLATVAKNLQNYNISKMEGDLDYKKIRTPLTPLTDDEKGYILNDVVIIEYFIREAIERAGGSIVKIPLTNTGYVRNYVRENTINEKEVGKKRYKSKQAKEYKDLMNELTLEPEEYLSLRQSFAGGFTHANAKYMGKTQENIKAKDFASSYPARMIMYKYPMSKGVKYIPKSKEDVFDKMKTHCCNMKVVLAGLICKSNEGYISEHKVIKKAGVVSNNGRVYQAQALTIWCTNIDLECIMMSYSVEDFCVKEMWIYKSGYLPTSFIKSIVKLYKDKTELKDVEGYELEYVLSKGMLNSTYGMSVMDIIQESFEWCDVSKDSIKLELDLENLINKENKSHRRFLFYAWGVWITAYSRYDLFKDIIALGDDYVYSDTDCIYYKKSEKADEIFKKSNDRITDLLKKASKHHGIDFSDFEPKDPKGRKRRIGVWDDDGEYKRFKTLGAKRYMVEDMKGNINITVSGVNKSTAVPYLKDKYGDDIFEHFNHGLEVPAGHCGKSTHIYIDEEKAGIVKDYNGISYEYFEYSGIHLDETSYNLSISNEYQEFCDWLRTKK